MRPSEAAAEAGQLTLSMLPGGSHICGPLRELGGGLCGLDQGIQPRCGASWAAPDWRGSHSELGDEHAGAGDAGGAAVATW